MHEKMKGSAKEEATDVMKAEGDAEMADAPEEPKAEEAAPRRPTPRRRRSRRRGPSVTAIHHVTAHTGSSLILFLFPAAPSPRGERP